MPEPWFDPNLYAWIPGTFFGVACGILGGVAGTLAPRGKARSLVQGLFLCLLVASVLFLVTSFYAWYSGQPYGIWYGLGLPGLLGIILIPSLFPIILQRYRQAEERSIKAKDLE
jgi:peptidoglycan/LPS O-acetylase OafA/YrhL